MELQTLATFCCVVDEGGVLAASRKLHTVQSNVTGRIRRLEQELGTALFIRQGRGLVLTPAGRLLLQHARSLLQLERQASLAVRELADQGGELRIGTMETFAALHLPQLLSQLRQHHPKMTVTVTSQTTQALTEAVLRHELDCAFVGGPCEQAQLRATPVITEQLALVSSRDVPSHRALILFRQGCAYRQRALDWRAQQPGDGYDIMEMGTLEGILGCVAHGLGVTLMPAAVVQQSRYANVLTCQPLLTALAEVPTLLIQHRNLPQLPGLAILANGLSPSEHLSGKSP